MTADAPARPYRFEVYPDIAGGWRWRLVAGNGEIVADSSESYTRQRDAIRALRAFQASINDAVVED